MKKAEAIIIMESNKLFVQSKDKFEVSNSHFSTTKSCEEEIGIPTLTYLKSTNRIRRKISRKT